MTGRKYASGYEKLKKKRRIESLVQSQKGALNKYLVDKRESNSNQEVIAEEPSIRSDLENNVDATQEENLKDNIDVIQETEILEVNETLIIGNPNDEHVHVDNVSTELGKDETLNCYDPGQWKEIDTNLRDILVEKGPSKIDDIEFPKDENNRHFSKEYYIRRLPNEEKQDRRWLVYSTVMDRVFCFYCKLFGSKYSTSQLVNEGSRDWKNLGKQLKSQEITNEHILNMTRWIDLETRLSKKETIDKSVQGRINKEQEHWEKVLVRIIAVVKTFARNNLAFRGKKEKLYEDNNGNFLGLIEMIA